MTDKNLTEILEAEHRVIEKVVSAASELVNRIETGQKMDAETLRKIVEFMRTYADKCHHGKEEDLLFPALANKGVPTQGCPLGALIGEHARGRSYVAALAEGTDMYGNGNDQGLEKILKGLTGIAALYPNHIWKEDFLLFPMTHKVMNPVEQEAFLKPFEDVDKRIGQDTLLHFQEFAEQLMNKTQ